LAVERRPERSCRVRQDRVRPNELTVLFAQRRVLRAELLDRSGRALAGVDCFTQLQSVTAFTDSFSASRSHACLRDSSGSISSSTNLTACSLNSAVYSFFAGIY
jgi:hypothetical protein